MKKFILGFIVGGVICATVTGFAVEYAITANPYPVKVNGTETAIEGYNINNNTYFKLRDVADAVGGFEVGFSDNTITIDTGNVVVPEPTVKPEPTSIASLPTPEPVTGIDMEEIIETGKQTDDGISILNINGKEYVYAMDFLIKFDDDKFSITITDDYTVQLLTNTNIIVFDNIPSIVTKNRYHIYIDSEYYQSTIYPYLDEYCRQ